MVKNILSGFLYVVSSKVGMLIASVVITPILVRLIGSADYGEYAFALSIFSLIVIFTSAGLQTGVRKFVAEDREIDGWQSGVFTFYFRVAALLAIGGMIIILGLIELGLTDRVVSKDAREYLYVVVLMIPAHQLYILCRSGMMGVGLERVSEPLRVVERVLFGVIAISLAYAGYGVTGVLFGRFVALMLVGLAGLGVIGIQFDMRGVMTRTVRDLPRNDLLRYNWFSIVLAFLIASLYHTDIILIRAYTGSEQTGFYKGALVITSFLLFVPEAIQIVLLHSTSELWANNQRERISSIASRVVRYTLLGTLLLVLGLFVLANPFVKTYFGESFSPAVASLQLLLPGTVGFALARPIYAIGQGKGDLKPLIFATGSAAVINLVLNIALIPQYGIRGAAIATSIGYGSMFVFHTLAAYRIGFEPLSDLRIGRIVVTGISALIPIYIAANAIDNNILSLLVVPPIGFTVFTITCLGTNAISADELRELI